jgi:hypothetical protein
MEINKNDDDDEMNQFTPHILAISLISILLFLPIEEKVSRKVSSFQVL